MGAGYGFAGHIGFAKEASGGTPVAATDYIEALSEGLSLAPDRFETKNIIGRFSEAQDESGVNRIAGPIVFPAMPNELGFFLLGATGIQSNTVVLSGFLHTHEFTMRTADWDSVFASNPFTFEIFRDVTSSQQYAGCNISRLEMSMAPNQDLRVSAQLIGKSTLNLQATTPTFTSSPASPFTFDTASIQLPAGTATAQMEAFSLTIDNQLQGIPSLNNSKNIRAIRRTGPQMIRFSGTLAFENITEYLNFTNQTKQRIVASFTKANSFSMAIDLPQFNYRTFPLGMGGRDRQTISFEGAAEYNAGSGTAIKVSVTNTRSGY